MTNLKVILILILACLLAIFIAQNVAVIQMRFLAWDFFLSRALLVFFTLVAGFIIGWFASSLICWRRSKAAQPDEKPE
jgi:putative membrane protein